MYFEQKCKPQILGNMNFLKEPNPMNLNGNHFGQLIQTSWFLDDRTIEFMYATHFENVVWHNAITLTVF